MSRVGFSIGQLRFGGRSTYGDIGIPGSRNTKAASGGRLRGKRKRDPRPPGCTDGTKIAWKGGLPASWGAPYNGMAAGSKGSVARNDVRVALLEWVDGRNPRDQGNRQHDNVVLAIREGIARARERALR